MPSGTYYRNTKPLKKNTREKPSYCPVGLTLGISSSNHDFIAQQDLLRNMPRQQSFLIEKQEKKKNSLFFSQRKPPSSPTTVAPRSGQNLRPDLKTKIGAPTLRWFMLGFFFLCGPQKGHRATGEKESGSVPKRA